MNTARNFYRFGKRQFSNYHYYHDFNPEYIMTNNKLNFILVFADIGRLFGYLVLGTCVLVHLPTLIVFKKSRFIDNPDYMLKALPEANK